MSLQTFVQEMHFVSYANKEETRINTELYLHDISFCTGCKIEHRDKRLCELLPRERKCTLKRLADHTEQTETFNSMLTWIQQDIDA